MPKKSFKPVKEQCSFCYDLMRRLDKDIHDAVVEFGYIYGHTPMQNDIIRLRRELMTLSKMLGEWGYEE